MQAFFPAGTSDTMWFKNLQLYRLTTPWPMTVDHLQTLLATLQFHPCGSQEQLSRGWVAPREHSGLVYQCNKQLLLAMATEQRLLPGSVVNQELEERLQALEEQQGYKPGRKQKADLKDQITQELLPRAFTRRRKTWLWLDPVNGWLGIDAANVGRADEVLELLRKVVPDIPLRSLNTTLAPATAMADWLASGEGPAGFSVDRDCELRSPADDAATVRFVRHPLEGEDVTRHLADGKIPTRLALTWNDRISFLLTDRLEIKRLAYLERLKEEGENSSAGNADEEFAALFLLMTGELAKFLEDVVAALGGEQATV